MKKKGVRLVRPKRRRRGTERYLPPSVRKKVRVRVVDDEIENEKALVDVACHGIVHPDQYDRAKFVKWLRGVVVFHLDNLKKRIEGASK